MTHLTDKAAEVASMQGWDDDSIIIHLLGYIHSKGLGADLGDYLAQVAKEERMNVQWEDQADAN